MTKRVLITRSKKRAAELLGLLGRDGIEAFAVPVTKVIYLADLSLPDLADYTWLAFTSVNGVNAFKDTLITSGKSLPETIKIASVGSGTAMEIKRLLRPPDLIPRNPDGLSLAKEILETRDSASELSILWPCAENALTNFPDGLRESGARIDRWICYRVERIESSALAVELKSIAPWDIALFAAPSAVRSFTAAWPRKDGFTALAIGQTTLKELLNSGFSDTAVSDGVSNSDCFLAINEIFNKRNIGSL